MESLEKAIQDIRRADETGDNIEAYRLVDQGVIDFPDSGEMWDLAVTLRLWRGDSEGATQALAKAKELAPDTALTLAVESDFIAFHGDQDTALSIAQQAIANSPDQLDPWVVERCSSAMSMANNHSEALELCDRMIALYPDDARGSLIKSMILTLSSQIDEAAKLQQEMEAKYPGNPFVMRNTARFLARQQKISDAVNMLQKAVDIQPNNWSILAEYASYLSFAHRLDEAEKYALKALEISKAATMAMSTMARVCRERGEKEEAAKWSEKAQLAIPALVFMKYMNAANEALRNGDYKKVGDMADEALKLNPPRMNRILALEQKCRSYIGLQQHDKVPPIISQLTEMNHDSAAMYEFRASVLVAEERQNEALDIYRQGLMKYPISGVLTSGMLKLLHSMNMETEEAELIGRIFDNIPQQPWEITAIYTALDDTKHYEESQRLLKIAREKFPNSSEFILFEAIKKIEKGDIAGASELAKNIKGPYQKPAQMISAFDTFQSQIMDRLKKVFGKKPTQKPPTLN